MKRWIIVTGLLVLFVGCGSSQNERVAKLELRVEKLEATIERLDEENGLLIDQLKLVSDLSLGNADAQSAFQEKIMEDRKALGLQIDAMVELNDSIVATVKSLVAKVKKLYPDSKKPKP